ncbi:MAG: type IV pilus twitching motility protein PilT [Firmicutes bacterium]|nr:type IV pilus twitching motility protein PilT [Bacillota bacterium]
MHIDEILAKAVELGASDIHLAIALPPMLRINGKLVPMEGYKKLFPEDTHELVYQMLKDYQKKVFEERGELDFSYGVPSLGRFRVNAYRQRGSVCAALRVIPTQVPDYKTLGLPEVIPALAQKIQGLILVTGPTGSGKSTTLASIIDLINRERYCHILTLEDPIEYLHRHNKSIINQREIGLDSQSFASALKASLRQDPDVILVGEMRDIETIGTALTAAETGHLVLATLHTNNAVGTVDRIVDVFPPHQQPQIRLQLATVLEAVIAQQLLPRADGKGRVAAFEILLATPAVRNLIREGKTHQIMSLIQTGGRLGMKSFEMAYKELLAKGLVTRETLASRLSDNLRIQQVT